MELEDGEPASSRLSHMPQEKPAPLRYSADAYGISMDRIGLQSKARLSLPLVN